MSDNIEIRVDDKVAASIDKKLERIENRARSGFDALERLNKALAAIQPRGLAQLEAAVSRGQRELDRAALASQRLATEQSKTAKAVAQAEAAQSRLNITNERGAISAANLAAAQHKQAAASMDAEAALNRAVASETAAAAAAAKLSAAQNGIAASAAQAGAAQAHLATAQARTQTEQNRGAQTAQRLATEQQRTATAAAQAAAAQDRAALAALRLQQAQERAAAASERASSGLAGFLRTALAFTGIGVSAAAILSAADAYTVLQNKLQNVSETQAQNNRLTNEAFSLANRVRVPVEDIATAYARYDAALLQVGASQQESLRITETISKALKVGGATAAEAGSAMLQLSQAFTKGKLNGDEFRSVMENMPPFIKKAIAEAAKVPISGIFDAAAKGKITLDVLREAFSKLSTVVDQKFAKTVPTLSESLTVLKNRFIQTWGEINKSLGITTALSGLILGLANNLDVLGVAITALGGLMALYFGQNLLTMFGRATGAVRAFTLAIAANPIGLIAVAISTALVALVAFSDRIKLTTDGVVTLRDGFAAAWSFIKDGAAIAAEFVGSAWNKAIDFINSVTGGWAEQFRNATAAIITIGKAVINNQIASFVAGYRIITTTWANFPAFMEVVFNAVVNAAAGQVEALVNMWQTGLRAIAKGAEGIAPEIAESLNGTLDNMTIKLPRLEGSKAAQDFSKQVGGIVKDAFNTDYVGVGVDAFMKRAREIAEKRRKSEADGLLRGAGPKPPGGEDGDAKAAEKRARAMQLVNKQLDDELSRMFMLKPEREIQQKFDQIESELLRKKITLNAQEAASIKAKLKAIEDAKFVQQEFDRIYEAAVEPLRTRNAAQEAANKLLAMGAITQDQYNRELVKSSEAYKEATDPLYRFNREIEQNVELLKLLPQQREVGQKLQQIQNDLLTKGIVLTQQETEALRKKLEVEKQLNDVAQIQNQLYSDSNAGKAKQFADTISAIQGLMQNKDSGFGKSDAIGSLAQSMPNLFENTPELLQSNTANFQNMYKQIEAMRQADLISEQTAAAMRFRVWNDTQNLQLNAASGFFGQLSQLQKSENSKMAKIGKAAAIAQALIQTYQGATAAYASLAPIPYVGPALGVAAAAAAVAAGLANVAQIRSQNTGFKTGGYTGDFGVNTEVGPVHGKEFVFDAQSTARIGPANLEAMRRGAAQVNQTDKQAGKASAAAAAPVVVSAPPVTVQPAPVVVVDSEEKRLATLRSAEGKALVMEAVEANPNKIQKIAGSR